MSDNKTKETKKRLSFEEFKEKSRSKIITDNKLREFTLDVSDEEELVFRYKPLTKSQYFSAQATLDAGKAVDHILTSTLWDPAKGKNGDFWSVEDLNDTFDFGWQARILTEILNGEGQVVTEKDKDF